MMTEFSRCPCCQDYVLIEYQQKGELEWDGDEIVATYACKCPACQREWDRYETYTLTDWGDGNFH